MSLQNAGGFKILTITPSWFFSGKSLGLRIRNVEGTVNSYKRSGPLVVYNSKSAVLKRIDKAKTEFIFLYKGGNYPDNGWR